MRRGQRNARRGGHTDHRRPRRKARRAEPRRKLGPRTRRRSCRRESCRSVTAAGDLPHGARQVGSRRQLGNQRFDLAPRLVPGPCEDGLVVLRREVRPQQTDGGQAQRARSQEIEDQREAPAGPSGLDAVAGGILGEPKGLRAIAEERTIALSGVEHRAAIERGQMGDQLGQGFALPAGEPFEAGKEVLIRQRGGGDEDVGIHSSYVSRRISRTGRGPGMPQGRV